MVLSLVCSIIVEGAAIQNDRIFLLRRLLLIVTLVTAVRTRSVANELPIVFKRLGDLGSRLLLLLYEYALFLKS